MVFFVRARSYYTYAESLLKEIQTGVRPLTPTLALDIFTLGLKALRALEVAHQEEKKPTLDELIQRIPASVSSELLKLISELREELVSLSPENLEQKGADILQKLSEYLRLVKEELRPIL